MIDEELYRETFSKLLASDEAKKEVLQNMKEQKNKRRLPKVLRIVAIAAILVAVLAVSVSAAENDLLGFIEFKLTTIFNDGFHEIAVDENGNEWNAFNLTIDTELRDGRLILKAMTQEFDITDDLLDDGEAVHTFTQDGYDMTVTVVGTLEEHSLFSSSDFAGISCETKPSSNTEGYRSTLISGPFSSDGGEDSGDAPALDGVESGRTGYFEFSEDSGTILSEEWQESYNFAD